MKSMPHLLALVLVMLAGLYALDNAYNYTTNAVFGNSITGAQVASARLSSYSVDEFDLVGPHTHNIHGTYFTLRQTNKGNSVAWAMFRHTSNGWEWSTNDLLQKRGWVSVSGSDYKGIPVAKGDKQTIVEMIRYLDQYKPSPPTFVSCTTSKKDYICPQFSEIKSRFEIDCKSECSRKAVIAGKSGGSQPSTTSVTSTMLEQEPEVVFKLTDSISGSQQTLYYRYNGGAWTWTDDPEREWLPLSSYKANDVSLYHKETVIKRLNSENPKPVMVAETGFIYGIQNILFSGELTYKYVDTQSSSGIKTVYYRYLNGKWEMSSNRKDWTQVTSSATKVGGQEISSKNKEIAKDLAANPKPSPINVVVKSGATTQPIPVVSSYCGMADQPEPCCNGFTPSRDGSGYCDPIDQTITTPPTAIVSAKPQPSPPVSPPPTPPPEQCGKTDQRAPCCVGFTDHGSGYCEPENAFTITPPPPAVQPPPVTPPPPAIQPPPTTPPPTVQPPPSAQLDCGTLDSRCCTTGRECQSGLKCAGDGYCELTGTGEGGGTGTSGGNWPDCAQGTAADLSLDIYEAEISGSEVKTAVGVSTSPPLQSQCVIKFKIGYFLNGVLIKSLNVEIPSPAARFRYEFPASQLREGGNALKIVADHENSVNDPLRSNNEKTQTLTLARSGKFDLVPKVVLTPSSASNEWEPGQKIKVELYARNMGEKATTSIWDAYKGDPLYRTKIEIFQQGQAQPLVNPPEARNIGQGLDKVQPNAELLFQTVEWTPSAEGTYTLTPTLDFNKMWESADANPGNNKGQSITIAVKKKTVTPPPPAQQPAAKKCRQATVATDCSGGELCTAKGTGEGECVTMQKLLDIACQAKLIAC